jgi:hypothetical protein
MFHVYRAKFNMKGDITYKMLVSIENTFTEAYLRAMAWSRGGHRAAIIYEVKADGSEELKNVVEDFSIDFIERMKRYEK